MEWRGPRTRVFAANSIAEAEQTYIALKDVGVETVFVRYPREGPGLAEPKHQVDSIQRAFEWYDRQFAGPVKRPTGSVL